MQTLKNLFRSQETLVVEIHHEFDAVQDRLLSEAKAVIAKSSEPLANRLAAAGFVNTPTAKQLPALVQSKEQAELIQYYQQNYPFQKFLTEQELDRICKKYNLIYAPVANYIKDVPEKNLSDIENAKPLHDAFVKSSQIAYKLSCNFRTQENLFKRFTKEFGKDTFTHEEAVAILAKTGRSYFTKDFAFLYSGVFYGENLLTTVVETKTELSGLFIAAPKSHFNIKDLKKSGTFGFMNITVREVKDPIVFRYCKGGIQVLTKWGLEAADPLVVNALEN